MPDVLREFEAGYADIENLLEETGCGVDRAAHSYMWRARHTALLGWVARTHFAVEKRIYQRLPRRSTQARQLVERGLEEHLMIQEQLDELSRVVGCGTAAWQASFEQLRTTLELHAMEAEAALIPYARRQLKYEAGDELPALLRMAHGIYQRRRDSL